MGGAVQHFALLGEDEPAGMAVEQRHVEIGFKGADLAADGGLRQGELMARMGKASGVRYRVKNPELVPIHGSYSAALRTCSLAWRYFSTSRAAMQPMPAAVTAWR